MFIVVSVVTSGFKLDESRVQLTVTLSPEIIKKYYIAFDIFFTIILNLSRINT